MPRTSTWGRVPAGWSGFGTARCSRRASWSGRIGKRSTSDSFLPYFLAWWHHCNSPLCRLSTAGHLLYSFGPAGKVFGQPRLLGNGVGLPGRKSTVSPSESMADGCQRPAPLLRRQISSDPFSVSSAAMVGRWMPCWQRARHAASRQALRAPGRQPRTRQPPSHRWPPAVHHRTCPLSA